MLQRRGSAAILLKALFTGAVLIIPPALAVRVVAKGNFTGHTDRPLCYRPDGTDFVVGAVHEDGKLGGVQQIGAAPATVRFEDSQEYGTGAFLLAGTEMFKLK